MSFRPDLNARSRLRAPRRRALKALGAGALGLAGGGWTLSAAAADWPITSDQRSVANQTAQAGVPLTELSPNAPERYTVKRGDTLWDISGLFLRRPWHWPQLWGMNLQQIRNPHLIYPGQVLVLERRDGRALLRLAGRDGPPTETVRLSPRARVLPDNQGAITSVSMQAIGPFLNQAVILRDDALASAPRIVASQENRVLLSKGELAYVRGELGGQRNFAVFREAKPMLDPTTREVLGFEANFVGTAEFLRGEGVSTRTQLPVPATVMMTSVRQEAGIGDRLTPLPPSEFAAYVPHAPGGDVLGQVISVYGDAMTGGQNQVVAINRGLADGMERGHVLTLWRAGRVVPDRTQGDAKQLVHLPDERNGLLFVFRVFDRVSYALIDTALEPVRPGDWFTHPQP